MDINSEFVVRSAPSEWLEVASELKQAADLLADDAGGLSISGVHNETGEWLKTMKRPTLTRPWFLLVGYCLENLLKALIVLRHPSVVAEGKLSGQVKSHNLLDLAKQIPFELTAEECRLLSLAQKAVPYWGRYPIPLDAKDLADEVASDELLRISFERIFIRVENEITTAMLKGWVGPNGERIRTQVHQILIDGVLRDWQPRETPE